MGPSAQLDLVFGVVAFDPLSGCGRKCDAYRKGVLQWMNSVRMHTDAAHTEVTIFTGERRGSVTMDSVLARSLRAGAVRVVEGDFADTDDRVAHHDRRKYVRCVMRNRWFVIRDYLREHAGRYRYVLMTDVRDAVMQADPFSWTPHQDLAGSSGDFDLSQSLVLSGEGSGKVRYLRESKKGVPRTLRCAGNADEQQRGHMLDTEPLNAGVTVGGAVAFLNFTSALSSLISRVTTTECIAVKDCTDQGLYNLLVYLHWDKILPHTRRMILPMEHSFSYTLGHKRRRPTVDQSGRVRNDHGELPPVVHQYAKGSAGQALRSSRFRSFLKQLQGTRAR